MKNVKIWVLDDDPDDRNFIERSFKKKGLENFEIVETSMELFERAESDDLDILAVDFHLRGDDPMNGADVVRQAKEMNDDCFTIAMSGQVSERDYKLLIKASANDIIDKKGSMLSWAEELADAIYKAIPKAQRKKQLRIELQQLKEQIEEGIRTREKKDDDANSGNT